MYTIIGHTGYTDAERSKIYEAIKSCVKRYQSGSREGQYYASTAAVKDVLGSNFIEPVKWTGPDKLKYGLVKIAKSLCKAMNGISNGQKVPIKTVKNFVKQYKGKYGGDDELIWKYCKDAIFWDPSYRRHRVDTPLIGYGEGDMISVRDRLGGSIRGYGRRRRRRHSKKRRSSSSCCGGSIRDVEAVAKREPKVAVVVEAAL